MILLTFDGIKLAQLVLALLVFWLAVRRFRRWWKGERMRRRILGEPEHS